jgi:hypothetical protein
VRLLGFQEEQIIPLHPFPDFFDGRAPLQHLDKEGAGVARLVRMAGDARGVQRVRVDDEALVIHPADRDVRVPADRIAKEDDAVPVPARGIEPDPSLARVVVVFVVAERGRVLVGNGKDRACGGCLMRWPSGRERDTQEGGRQDHGGQRTKSGFHHLYPCPFRSNRTCRPPLAAER